MKAYIIGSSATDITTVKQLLASYQIDYFDPHSDIVPSQSWVNSIQKAIKEAHLIVTVFNSESKNIYFELGYCYGLKKKIFLILPENETLPFEFSDVFFIQAQPNNYKKIEYAFFTFITVNFPQNEVVLLDSLSAHKNIQNTRIELSKIYQQQKRWVEAEEVLKQLLNYTPGNSQAMLELGKIYQQQKRWVEAEEVLKQLLNYTPGNSQAMTELSKIYQQQKRWADAEEILKQLLNAAPHNLHAFTELAKVYQRSPRYDKAEKILMELLNIDPDNLYARMELSVLYQKIKKYDQAERMLLELLNIDPHNLQARTELSRIYQKTNKYDRAERMLLELLNIDSHNLQARTDLSRIYQKTNKYDRAERMLLELLNIDPHSLHARTDLSRIYQKTNRYDQAERVLMEMLNLSPHNLQVKSELSKLYQHQGKFSQADHILQKGIEQDTERKMQRYKFEKLANVKNLIQIYSETLNYQVFEEAVKALFEILNIHITVENKLKKAANQPDFSLWIDNMPEILGNPILVETKAGHLSENLIKQTVAYLCRYLKDSNAKAGIILYKDINNSSYEHDSSLTPPILILNFDDLLNRLYKENFSDILREVIKRKQQEL